MTVDEVVEWYENEFRDNPKFLNNNIAGILEAIRRNLCGYASQPGAVQTCDCKWVSSPSSLRTGEQTGCCELRAAIEVLRGLKTVSRSTSKAPVSPVEPLIHETGENVPSYQIVVSKRLRWDVESALAGGAVLETLLYDGWEPFSTSANLIYLRKAHWE